MNKEKEALVRELHKPARRNYPRRHVDIRGIDETWQADLVDLSSYASQNSNQKFLLTVIDVFSKYAWAVPMKTKSGKDTSRAMKSILAKGRVPQKLHVDQGKEFYNSEFQTLMKDNKIHMYSTYSNLKASICERFNRTLKDKMWLQFSLRGSYKWTDILDNLILQYNNTVHRTIKMKPNAVNKKNEKLLLRNIFNTIKTQTRKKNKFMLGDKVRISKYKNVFAKGYTPNWSTEIFTISQVRHTNPVTYKLSDYQNESIAGGFYEYELLKVQYPDIYLVEKVISKRGKKCLVKWLGFDNSHNSWIDKSDL